MRFVCVLPILTLVACGNDAPVTITWAPLSDGSGDDRFNPGESGQLSVQVEANSDDPLGLEDVAIVATLAGPLLDDSYEATEQLECSVEGVNLGLMYSGCDISFRTQWLDAAAEQGELSLKVDVTDAGDKVLAETFSIDLLPLRAEVGIDGVEITSDSNSDGVCSPGERCTIRLHLSNSGQDKVVDGDFDIVTTSADVEIDSGASGTLWSLDGGDATSHDLSIGVGPAVSAGTPVTFEARFVDVYGNTWTDTVQVPIVAPNVNLQVSAARVTTGDGTLASGQSFQLDVTVENIGSSDALDVDAILSTSSEYLEIDGNTAGYWEIESGDSGTQSFSGRLLETTPSGATLEFFLTMEDAFGNIYSDSFSLVEGSSGVALLVEDSSLTEISGDGDGRVEPGEAYYLDLTVGNAGAVLAAGVEVARQSVAQRNP